jgi:CP family cyanate transporter-like MFS transporter
MKHEATASGHGAIVVPWRRILVCVLIILVGFNLRTVILGVPPVLPLITHDLRLSYSITGLLTAIPVLTLGIAGWPSGLLAERIGPRLCVSIGLALLAVGAILRAALPNTLSLFLFTLLLSLGIALAQTAISVLIRHWFPGHIGLLSALFSDGLIVGESIAAGFTVPIMVGWLGKDGWTGTFVLWGVPVLVLLALWLWLAPPAPILASERPAAPAAPARSGALPAQRRRVSALHLGIMIGAGSLIYYGMNGWIASYNQAMHHADLTPFVLVILNSAQLPVSLAITFIAQQIAGRRWPFVVAGLICAASIAGWVFAPASLEPLWAALLGGSSALVFTLGIALPPLLAEPGKVGRLTGITLSLTYGVAFVGPFLGGELWDLLHLPAVAFLPVGIASVMLVVLGALLPTRPTSGPFAETTRGAESASGAAVYAQKEAGEGPSTV